MRRTASAILVFFYDRIKDFFGGFHNWIATSKQQEKEKDPVRLSEKNESPVIEKGQDNNIEKRQRRHK